MNEFMQPECIKKSEWIIKNEKVLIIWNELMCTIKYHNSEMKLFRMISNRGNEWITARDLYYEKKNELSCRIVTEFLNEVRKNDD